ncbi:MAG: hypothetical protein HY292_12815 [Planctomycetes bacterium]|nr:hypothetical protein [Planctomycetota bacterium]
MIALGFATFAFAGDREPDEAVYARAAHGNPVTGVKRRAELQAGDCLQCHSLHGPRSPVIGLGGALFAPNDNRLCATCHPSPSADGKWPGMSAYEGTAHARAPRIVWTGVQSSVRTGSPNGLCLSCHTPHGVGDDNGLVPALTWRRGDDLCLACHGDHGPAHTNVFREISKASTHSRVVGASRSEGPAPASGFGPVRTHSAAVACVDCHNPHLDSNRDKVTGRPSGIWQFDVTFGARGKAPTVSPVTTATKTADGDSGLCLRCHAGETKGSFRPVPSVAAEFHPQNASFHAVFAPGTDATIPRESFTGDWTARSRLRCIDCHGSDESRVKGPHGSRYQPLLVRPYSQSVTEKSLRPEDLCLSCHRAATYVGGSAGADPKEQKASRFNPPATPGGHSLHSGQRGISCFACHDAHGSEKLPHLLTASRSGGITAFKPTRDGGECASTCHRTPSVTYTRNEGF